MEWHSTLTRLKNKKEKTAGSLTAVDIARLARPRIRAKWKQNFSKMVLSAAGKLQ